MQQIHAFKFDRYLLQVGENESEVEIGLLEKSITLVIALKEKDEPLATDGHVARQLHQSLVSVILGRM